MYGLNRLTSGEILKNGIEFCKSIVPSTLLLFDAVSRDSLFTQVRFAGQTKINDKHVRKKRKKSRSLARLWKL